MAKRSSASRLSAALIGLLILLLALLGGGSLFLGALLLKESSDTTHAQIDADISTKDPSRLEELKQYLAAHADDIAQTEALAGGLGGYDQSSINSTLTGYAKTAGVTISGYNFATASTSTVTSGDITFSLSLNSPLKYTNFITFLQLLEKGSMPATVTSVTLSGDDGGNITISPLTIKVAG